VHLDLIGSSAVTIRDYGTIVHKRKLVLELTQGDFPTNCPPRWLALYGYLQINRTHFDTGSLAGISIRVSLDFVFGLRASVLGLHSFSSCDSLLW
jgi:hypothetical protein